MYKVSHIHIGEEIKMSDKPLLMLNHAALSFGAAPLFSDLSLSIHLGERICLVGRNGSGKSSLMKLMCGLHEADEGDLYVAPNVRVSYLSQTPDLTSWSTALEAVQSALHEDQSGLSYLAESYLKQLNVDPHLSTQHVSGGEARKIALARAMVNDPHLLLLDEPTNHLDLPSIEWLENCIKRLSSAVILISHDRALLERCTQKTWWVDRGHVRQLNSGFKRFEQWRQEVDQEESKHLNRMDKTLQQEMQWLREGISARRTRNQGRLRRLMQLREEKSSWRKKQGTAGLKLKVGQKSGKIVIDAHEISKSFESRSVVPTFSCRIMRGDKIGIIGPNGAGKSTLLKLLCADLASDSGTIKHGTQIEKIVIDQNRTLDPEATLQEILCIPNSDRVMVHDQLQHVAGYLQKFLFTGHDARRKVMTLSGGERARLLLAQQLTQSANLMILDEPTNDLDLETLELLQDILGEYEGTLLMVSHDRDFLDKVVTSIMAFEEDGSLVEYAGGYSDMLAQRKVNQSLQESHMKHPIASASSTYKKRAKVKTKLSYKEQKELEQLQKDIEVYTDEIDTLEAKLSDPIFYQQDPQIFEEASRTLVQLKETLSETEERWLTLEMLKEELASAQ